MSLRAAFPNSHLSDPASSEAIDKVEEKLGVKFPPALRALYLECDGFREPKGNAKYLLSLTNDDFIGSLIKTTQMLWTDKAYWKPTGTDPLMYVFFGYSSGDEVWGIKIQAPHEVIEYHHNQEDELTHLGSDIIDIYKCDFQKYED